MCQITDMFCTGMLIFQIIAPCQSCGIPQVLAGTTACKTQNLKSTDLSVQSSSKRSTSDFKIMHSEHHL